MNFFMKKRNRFRYFVGGTLLIAFGSILYVTNGIDLNDSLIMLFSVVMLLIGTLLLSKLLNFYEKNIRIQR